MYQGVENVCFFYKMEQDDQGSFIENEIKKRLGIKGGDVFSIYISNCITFNSFCSLIQLKSLQL